jgi:hypothetical protein
MLPISHFPFVIRADRSPRKIDAGKMRQSP